MAQSVAVNLLISDETLLGSDDIAAVVDRHGPILAMTCTLVIDAGTDTRSRATLRQL